VACIRDLDLATTIAEMFTVEAGAATLVPQDHAAVIACTITGPLGRRPDPSVTATKIALPFGDDGRICCWRHLFTLSMS